MTDQILRTALCALLLMLLFSGPAWSTSSDRPVLAQHAFAVVLKNGNYGLVTTFLRLSVGFGGPEVCQS